jgi:transcriptional regulator with XRE-family HTH domain
MNRTKAAHTGFQPSEATASATISGVGARIRVRRRELGLTLNEVSERTGVSVSMLSMVERGVAGASIGTLVAVVSALGVHMYDLFEDKRARPESPVTRKHDHPEVMTSEGVLRRLVHHSRPDGLELALNEYEPGTASGDAAVHHNGHEFGMLLSGTLTIELDGVEHPMRPGDSIAFDSTVPHRFVNTGRGKARAIWVNIDK